MNVIRLWRVKYAQSKYYIRLYASLANKHIIGFSDFKLKDLNTCYQMLMSFLLNLKLSYAINYMLPSSLSLTLLICYFPFTFHLWEFYAYIFNDLYQNAFWVGFGFFFFNFFALDMFFSFLNHTKLFSRNIGFRWNNQIVCVDCTQCMSLSRGFAADI